MAESCSDSDLEEFQLYKERDEWKDVEPVSQNDGDHAVVRIAYSEEFRDVYDYFRAVLRSGEKSERVLALTADAIKMNSANYTVWQHRRVVLKHLKSDLNDELEYITKTINSHPKNYQVWFLYILDAEPLASGKTLSWTRPFKLEYHRQVIVKWLNDPSNELSFTASILDRDSKNYHAWQHRQWVLKTYSLWDEELQYINQLIQQDMRNNSAWNHRYFVICSTTKWQPEIINSEIKYTLDIINKARRNESPWNYLRGILANGSFSEQPQVKAFIDRLYETEHCRSPHLLAFIVDMIEDELSSHADQPSLYETVLAVCAELAMEHDTIREAYWTYRGNRIEQLYAKVTNQ